MHTENRTHTRNVLQPLKRNKGANMWQVGWTAFCAPHSPWVYCFGRQKTTAFSWGLHPSNSIAPIIIFSGRTNVFDQNTFFILSWHQILNTHLLSCPPPEWGQFWGFPRMRHDLHCPCRSKGHVFEALGALYGLTSSFSLLIVTTFRF